MKRPLGILVLLFCIVARARAGPLVDAKGEPFTVVVDSVDVAGAGYKGELVIDRALIDDGPPYTRIGLVVLHPDGGLIRLRHEESEVSLFTDDLGTDLLDRTRPKTFFPREFDFSHDVSRDGKSLALRVGTPRIASAGARSLTIRGKLALDVGTRKQTLVFKSLSLTEGTTLNAWPRPYKIQAVSDTDWQDYTIAVQFGGGTDCRELLDIEFLDSEEKRIQSEQYGSSYGRFGTNISGSKTFALKESVNTATVELTYWEETKRVVVPFEVKVCLGLGAPDAALLRPAAPKAGQDNQPPENVQVRIAEICTTDTLEGQERNLLIWNEGTFVSLLAIVPDGQIMRINPDHTAMTAFADDRGTDLSADASLSTEVDGQWVIVSSDRKAIVLGLYSPVVPNKNATRIRVAGKLAILTGSEKKVVDVQDVPIRAGATFAAGPLRFKISDAFIDEDDDQILVLTAGGEAATFEQIRFLNKDGDRVEFFHHRSTSAENGLVLDGLLDEPMETATIEVVFWSGKKEIVVPFDVAAGLGLEEPAKAEER